MIAVNTQTMVFLQSLLMGAVLGAIYDMFRIFRIAIPLPAGAIVVEDVLYFGFCGFLSFFFAMTVNYGQVRFFILLGEVLGFVLYYFTLGALIMKCAEKIIAFIRWVCRTVWKYLLRPIVRLCCWIGKKIGKIFGKVGQTAKKAAQKQRKHLKTGQVLLYNYFKK